MHASNGDRWEARRCDSEDDCAVIQQWHPSDEDHEPTGELHVPADVLPDLIGQLTRLYGELSAGGQSDGT